VRGTAAPTAHSRRSSRRAGSSNSRRRGQAPHAAIAATRHVSTREDEDSLVGARLKGGRRGIRAGRFALQAGTTGRGSAPRAPAWTFVAGVVVIVPLAEWIRRGTEHVARRSGSAVGGLLNSTFGNAAELVLAIVVLLAGKADVVKAQITGSIIGNGLLGFGVAITVGTRGRRELRFRPERAALLSSLLMLAVIALLVLALFDYTERRVFASAEATMVDENLSLSVAVVLIAVYAANLAYTLITHRDVFALDDAEENGPVGEHHRRLHDSGGASRCAGARAPLASVRAADEPRLQQPNPLELVAIASVAFVVNAITRDGEATRFEGVMLVAVYALLAFAFFFATPPPVRCIRMRQDAAPRQRDIVPVATGPLV
jgi:Ca2+/H+ antiporter